MNEYLKISPQVSSALSKGLPIVALESTIISHGMPYPKNVETALNVQKLIIDRGGVPATIAILGGKICVGLSDNEIDYLGKKGTETRKVSRSDMPYILAAKEDGATTVASTMIASSLAGIEIFATGGIGGVHRGAEKTMDISADLQELSKTNVTVICAGLKSILDLNLSLEYLETLGVPVIGYQTTELPAFYSRKSGLMLQYSANSSTTLADIIRAKRGLGLKGGLVVANPIPIEYELKFGYIENLIQNSISQANKLDIKGKQLTPFLLDWIDKHSSGRSLEANIQLVYNNARLATEVAKELSTSV